MAILIAFLVDAAFGYPQSLLAAIGHPVVWIGKLVAWLDRELNRETLTPRRRRLGGFVALAALLIAAVVPALFVELALTRIPFGFIAIGILGSSLLAQRSLYDHVAAVAEAMESRGLPSARTAVGRIVGRDTEALDAAGVARAAIESLAENFSDAIVAPAFWFALLGLAGAAAYKATNTADSMIGHKTPRYTDFGYAAARFDDLVNLPASRLGACLVMAAASLMPGASAKGALRALRGDARGHRSPNAGWPEAAVAGALGLALAGPRQYDGEVIEDAWMGRDGRRAATPADIRAALRLYQLADGLLILLTAMFAAVGLIGRV